MRNTYKQLLLRNHFTHSNQFKDLYPTLWIICRSEIKEDCQDQKLQFNFYFQYKWYNQVISAILKSLYATCWLGYDNNDQYHYISYFHRVFSTIFLNYVIFFWYQEIVGYFFCRLNKFIFYFIKLNAQLFKVKS